MLTLPPPVELAQDLASRWTQEAVIDHGLCPFAPEPWQQGRVRIEALRSKTTSQAIEDVVALAHTTLVDRDTETVLAVFPFALDDFDALLECVDIAAAYVEERELPLQLASFHPEYVFEGSDWKAPSNFTNRAPLPILQWLRANSVERAITNVDTAAIPRRNIIRFEGMDLATREALRGLPGATLTPCNAVGAYFAETDARVVFGATGIATTRRVHAGTYISPGPWHLHIKKGVVHPPGAH